MLLCFGNLQKKKIPWNLMTLALVVHKNPLYESHTECLFVAKSRISQKEKKHWLWMMDGQHLFYSWKWKKDHNAFTCTMTQNINNHGFIFQFWVNLRFKTLAQAPMGCCNALSFCWISHIIPRRNIVKKRLFFFWGE